MHFYNVMKKIAENKAVDLYIDMDGVIAAYDIGGNPYDFLNKRPLTSNISNIKEVLSIENVNLHILSVCRENSQVEDKNIWLDKNAPFFKKENRCIISRESKDWMNSKEIKLNFFNDLETDNQVVLVDDDNQILRTIKDSIANVIVMQDSELVD